MNRIYIVLVIWASLLVYCMFNDNVYVNGLILFFGLLFTVCALGYIMDNKNKKELRFFNKLATFFN